MVCRQISDTRVTQTMAMFLSCLILTALAFAAIRGLIHWKAKHRGHIRRRRKIQNEELNREWRIRDLLWRGSATRRLTYEPKQKD